MYGMESFLPGVIVGALVSSAITMSFMPKLARIAVERHAAKQNHPSKHTPKHKFPRQRKGE